MDEMVKWYRTTSTKFLQQELKELGRGLHLRDEDSQRTQTKWMEEIRIILRERGEA